MSEKYKNEAPPVVTMDELAAAGMVRKAYMAVKCPCGDAICKAWHVAPVADTQGVRFTEHQAREVAMLLNRMEDVQENGPEL